MVTLEGLGIAHGDQCVLRCVDLHLPAGSMTALMGANGAGKSSLLRCIAGLHPATQGRVRVDAARTQVAYLAQRSETERDFPISVFDCVLLGAWPRTGAWRGAGPGERAATQQALQRVGMHPLAQRPISALSEGQWQRVLFARMLVQDARLLLLDEPFAALDQTTTQDLLALLRSLHAEGRTLLVALHDTAQARAHFPATLHLRNQNVHRAPATQLRPHARARAAAARCGKPLLDMPA